MQHDPVEPQKNPETLEVIGYPHWASNGAPVTSMGIVVGCDCEVCLDRQSMLEELDAIYQAQKAENPDDDHDGTVWS